DEQERPPCGSCRGAAAALRVPWMLLVRRLAGLAQARLGCRFGLASIALTRAGLTRVTFTRPGLAGFAFTWLGRRDLARVVDDHAVPGRPARVPREDEHRV